MEEYDDSLHAAAMRELIEEVDLEGAVFTYDSKAVFDLDVHQIPENAKEPGHFHFDVRFHFFMDKIPIPDGGLKWVSLADAALFEQTSLSRFAQKLLNNKK